MSTKQSGQEPFVFTLCEDFYTLPPAARDCEVRLHGGFSVDEEGEGYIYYGMPGCGLMRIAPDLASQEIVELPSDLKPINFHSTRITTFDGKRRIVLPANENAKVVVVGLDGSLDFVLDRPEFEEYEDQEKPFAPTDVAAVGGRLYVADGYGSNYISTADLTERRWERAFGGKTKDQGQTGLFGTAHGLHATPNGHHLSIADRPHSRFQHFSLAGQFEEVFHLPNGSRPCGIDFHEHNGRWYALVASLDDPEKGRPAPIYILDAESYRVVSTIRPKEELGVELADHIHNAIWYSYAGQHYLICQAWNPGHYFVLGLVE